MKPGTLAELIAWLPPPQLEIIKHGILPQGAVMIIYGMAGVYKTFLVMDMAASISVAKPWLIYPTVKANTLVLNTEMPKIESRKRWILLA
jgi:RecA-family ATPase